MTPSDRPADPASGAAGRDPPPGESSAPHFQVPLDLPRLVMSRALPAALAVLTLALLLGALRTLQDTRQEMAGSIALARALAAIEGLPDAEPEAVKARLRELRPRMRHLRLELREPAGSAAGATRSTAAATQESTREVTGSRRAPSPLGASGSFSTLLLGTGPEEKIAWPIPLRDGRTWTLELSASPDSELRESLVSLAGLLGLLSLCAGLMLVAMRHKLRAAFSPLQSLLAAIARIESGDQHAVQALPPMPVRELEAIALALRHLSTELERAEAARRNLGLRLLGLQEDERQRLARELHDESGQRLTALRVDAAWLQRRVGSDPELAEVVAGMARQVALIQDDVRRLLANLQPLGSGDADEGKVPWPRVRALLDALVDGWNASAAAHGIAFVLAAPDATEPAILPAEIALGLYRISQEALTNVARHAKGADHAQLAIEFVRDEAGGIRALHWSAADDGCGIDDAASALCRGTGLAGLKDRIWALGGELEIDRGRPGLILRARLPLDPAADEADLETGDGRVADDGRAERGIAA